MSILVIDDNGETRGRIVRDLAGSGLFRDIHEAKNGLDGFRKVTELCPELILCDVEMPQMDGLKFLGMLNSKPETEAIPVLMLTCRDDRTVKLKVLAEGARDFIKIPYHPAELIARVSLHLKAKRLEDTLKSRNKELNMLSNKDHLTGAYNRRYLSHALDTELMRASRTGGVVSLLMLDIDHFKAINDNFGHYVGDQVLQQVTAGIGGALRDYDLLVRYGGEEFVAVLPGAKLSEATMVAQRLRQRIRKLTFAGMLTETVVTTSVGVACFPGADIRNAEALLAHADAALYQAKHCGRDQVVAHGYELASAPPATATHSTTRSGRRTGVQMSASFTS